MKAERSSLLSPLGLGGPAEVSSPLGPGRRFGFISQKSMDKGHGTVWYATTDGGEVECGAVDSDPEAKGYEWPDKRSVGEVCKYLRQGSPDTTGFVEFGGHS